MKECPYCGLENADDHAQCSTCHTPLSTPANLAEQGSLRSKEQYVISPQEQRFWDRMTFRQFAIVIVRLQALLMIIYAVEAVSHVLPYLNQIGGIFFSPIPVASELRLSVLMAILRVILYVVAAFVLIQRTEQLLSWMVKDSVQDQPPDKV